MGRIKKIFYCLLALGITAAVSIPLHYYIQFKQREKKYDSLIIQTAKRHDIDPALVKALILKESKFQAHVRGRDGEYGLMQLMPAAADDWMRLNRKGKFSNYDQLLKPEINLEIGTWFLARAMSQWKDYKHQTALALAQYNAGRKNVLTRKWVPSHKDGEVLKLITFPTTKAYIVYILEHKKHYKEMGIGK